MAQPLQPGDPARLGAYILVGRLGVGGQGVVYLARRPTPGGATMTDSRGSGPAGGTTLNPTAAQAADYCAIKLLRPDIAGDTMARARFLREADAARRVAQFCTAQVLDAGEDGDRLFMVTEYVAGPSLKQLVEEEGPRSGAALDRLAIGTATALVAIHQAGIVHRDFKPHNVIMGPDGPRVIDFGIARTGDVALTSTGASIGTPAYMAPEQVTGRPSGPATDMFAWAATMIYAATGGSPFGNGPIATIAQRILTTRPDLSALHEPLRSQVAACLDQDPQRRPQANQVLMGLLGTAVGPSGGGGEATRILSEGVMAAALGATMTAPPGNTPPMRPAANVAGDATAPGTAGHGRGRSVGIALAALLGAAVVVAAVIAILAAVNSGNNTPLPGPAGSGSVTPTVSTKQPTTTQPTTQHTTTHYVPPTTTAPTTTAPTTTSPTTTTTTTQPTTNPPT